MSALLTPLLQVRGQARRGTKLLQGHPLISDLNPLGCVTPEPMSCGVPGWGTGGGCREGTGAPVVKVPILAVQEVLVHPAGELFPQDQPLFRVGDPGLQVLVRTLVCRGDAQGGVCEDCAEHTSTESCILRAGWHWEHSSDQDGPIPTFPGHTLNTWQHSALEATEQG